MQAIAELPSPRNRTSAHVMGMIAETLLARIIKPIISTEEIPLRITGIGTSGIRTYRKQPRLPSNPCSTRSHRAACIDPVSDRFRLPPSGAAASLA